MMEKFFSCSSQVASGDIVDCKKISIRELRRGCWAVMDVFERLPGDFIQTMAAARTTAISDRRSSADKEGGESDESNLHLHGLFVDDDDYHWY
jgi:hypothetical protein